MQRISLESAFEDEAEPVDRLRRGSPQAPFQLGDVGMRDSRTSGRLLQREFERFATFTQRLGKCVVGGWEQRPAAATRWTRHEPRPCSRNVALRRGSLWRALPAPLALAPGMNGPASAHVSSKYRACTDAYPGWSISIVVG